jgi:hypothetical protein
VRALSRNIAGAEDHARAIELVGAISRLLEAAGVSLESEATAAAPPARDESPDARKAAS